MNQDPNNNNAFTENTNATQTNPFTGDLKGEFTSDFGTNTNAVSQMFKGGGPGGDKRKTLIVALGGVVLLALLVLLMTTEEESGFDDFSTQMDQGQEELAQEELGQDEDQELAQDQEDELADQEEGSEDALAEGDAEGEAVGEVDGEVDGEVGEMAEGTMAEGSEMVTTGSITVNQPFEGASLPYDETQGPATFSWSGEADRIVFARNSSMSPIIRSVNVTGRQSYRYLHPHPGTFYWRLENAEGGTPAQSFTIMPPIRRNVVVSQPTAGGSLGVDGVVAWQPDSKIAFYKVQLTSSGGSWSVPAHSFSTSGSSIQLQGVSEGVYDFRVGAFSEVAGRFEWQIIPGVQVGAGAAGVADTSMAPVEGMETATEGEMPPQM